ncbi:MAG: hypothetical protein GF372_05125 [Candidatus Marinimicrobia bacterium]|nr:hypothetical protein [Candidatus Neomarinimicrobiota bacterium]
MTAGLSQPVGTYAEKSANNEQSGFAKSGISVGGLVGISTSLDDKSQIIFGVNVFWNAMDMEAAVQAVFPASSKYYSMKKEEPYLSISPLVGIQMLEDLSESSTFFVSGMAGIMFARSPKIVFTIPIQDTRATITQDRDRSLALTWMVEGGIKFMNEFQIGVRYQYSNPKFIVSGNITDREGNSIYESVTMRQPIATVQILFGILL